MNFKTLKRIASTSVVCVLSTFVKQSSGVCSLFQFGKQLKIIHKVVQQISITKVLEFLLMGLMGDMQVESIVGKHYIFVCVDDFSPDSLG